MTSGRTIDEATWFKYQELRDGGLSMYGAAKKIGISYRAASDFEKGIGSAVGKAAKKAFDQAKSPSVVPYDLLSDEAREAYDDIEVFAKRYFGLILMPWQIEATNRIMELQASPQEEYVVINAPPGSGKSTFFTRILPAWATVRDRTLRGMIGSHTHRLGEWYTRRLKGELERTSPVKAEAKDLKMGLAVDAETCLVDDFGRFKPDVKEVWRGDQFTVAQEGDIPVSEKEPTWTCFGVDSGFLGGRFDLIIWDDLYDPRKMRTSEARDDLKRWWDEVAETRLEPGGLLVLQGQRMAGDDIYRYALDKEAIFDEEDDFEEDVPEELKLDGKRYHHLVYKAHYEDKCEKQHKLNSAPYPEGCLLYPRRLNWKKLTHVKSQTPDRYAILYQQDDADPASVLVDPLWISGGTGEDGVLHQGCWDNDRDLWELPKNLPGEVIIVATADPSPSKFWALQVWAYVPESGFRYLLESYRQKMDAPTFLDWNHEEGVFTGIAEEWWHRSVDMGHPINYWIVEANAAQKFILQYDHFRRWSAQRGVNLIPHYTHSRNKGDPDYGVQMLAPLYKHGRVRLPGKQRTEARPHALLLVNEVTKWSADGHGSATDDCVMAQWFLEHNLPNISLPKGNVTPLWRPTWMKEAS
ncbi:MAG: hypothetical protein CMG34_07810 [Candidatus Marinimicrobia bacterium]|nr:hypothetical protein [Candidatus Neomarinimicrobiota bacterium]